MDATETPVSAADVVINNTTYHIADNFTEEQIPADFTEATVNFRGTECRGLTFDKGTISLIYLETDNVDATTGRFFIYDETRDVVYDFMKFTAGESSYVIPLLAPLDSVLPESYVQVSLQMPENTVMTAYQLPVEDGEEASDFYIFYGGTRMEPKAGISMMQQKALTSVSMEISPRQRILLRMILQHCRASMMNSQRNIKMQNPFPET